MPLRYVVPSSRQSDRIERYDLFCPKRCSPNVSGVFISHLSQLLHVQLLSTWEKYELVTVIINAWIN